MLKYNNDYYLRNKKNFLQLDVTKIAFEILIHIFSTGRIPFEIDWEIHGYLILV